MLYDLNIAWSPSTTPDRLLRTLTLAASFGYDTIALNHTLELPFPSNPVAPFPPLSDITSSSFTKNAQGVSPTTCISKEKLPSVLHRATLPLADPAASNYRLPALASAYDILAIRPLTEKAFQNACLTLDIPLISLDMTNHFPFHFRPKPCMAAIARGVRFEVCYGQVLNADARGRSNFIGNVKNLVRATGGRGIVISSEAGGPLVMRAPADVVNLLSMWDLPSEKGLEGLRGIPRSVVVNEAMKRNGFRGVIDIKETIKQDAVENDANSRAPNAQSSKSKSQKHQNQNQKRKGENEDGQMISKRQAKKMKLTSRSVGSEKK